MYGVLPGFAPANGAERNFGAEDAPSQCVGLRVDALADCRCHQRVSDVIQLRGHAARPGGHGGSEFHHVSPESPGGEHGAGAGHLPITNPRPAAGELVPSIRFFSSAEQQQPGSTCSADASASSFACVLRSATEATGTAAATADRDAAGSILQCKEQGQSSEAIDRSRHSAPHLTTYCACAKPACRAGDGKRSSGSSGVGGENGRK